MPDSAASLSGSGGLTITGGGTLELTASNIYTGPTTLSGGILRLSNSAALPTGSNLTLDGGVVELAAGDFTRSRAAAGPGAVHGQRRRLRGRGGEPRREPRRQFGDA